MKTKQKWAVLGLCVTLFGAMLAGCSKPAEEPRTEGDGHNHKPGDGHNHKPGDKH